MKYINGNVLAVSLIAWFTAQALKVLIILLTEKRFDRERFIGAGGMPSAHSAMMSALATGILIVRGVNSIEFAIAVTVALVIMYDAAGIRRAAGEQARTLNKIIDELVNNDTLDEEAFEKDLKELLGHTPLQVCVGALLGVCAAILLI